ncbi:uncharacterized protein LOC135084323 [Ostrinia nubilalis]|uniref:uncharacterized protein LOC135084323 n=1 Tax=Ostrinia nubilalis TaxID=29057 RepID=UPI0030826065
MNNTRYRWCAVSSCKNTSVKTPEKLFIQVPNDLKMRNVWLEFAKRDPMSLSTKSRLYMCEDHFNLEQDMENFMEYKIMGSVKHVKMKGNITPSRLCYHSERKRKLSPSPSQPTVTKIQKVDFVQGAEKSMLVEDYMEPTASSSKSDVPILLTEKNNEDKETQVQTLTTDKSIQVQVLSQESKSIQANIVPHYRSKATQCTFKIRDQCLSPIKTSVSIATSPHIKGSQINIPSTSGVTTSAKRKLSVIFEEKSDSEISLAPSLSSEWPTPTKCKTTSDSSLLEELKLEDQKLYYYNTLSKIKKNSRLYLGIPNGLYFLVHIIKKHTHITEQHILLCLMKIRLNRTFSQLADDFGLSLSQTSQIFLSKLPLISKALSPFIKPFSPVSIKRNLPIAFRHRFHKVTCIIDCLEIQIQKPTMAVRQALTWSEYKKANTIKYLVACTPDGLVRFVSSGYGGRITDVQLVENCTFLDSLEPGTCILADRGFKHIEFYLKQRNFSLVRPPSVSSGSKLTKSEVRLTKQIASLRIHIERVIRRIREFAILKPHSVVNSNLIPILDECIVTACALINIQDSLIK